MIEKQDDFTTLVTDDINTIKTKKEVEKLQAEIDKIKNENEELTKKWYLRPQYIGAISPIIVGLLTIGVAWATGFLQAQSKLNEVQKMVFEQNKTTYDSIIKIKTLQADSLNIKSGGLIHRVDSLQKLKNYIEKKLVTVQNDKRGESEKTLSLVTQLGICESQVKELNENIRVINVGDTVKKLNERITALISSDSKLSNLRNWYASVLREKNNKIIALENLLKEKNK